MSLREYKLYPVLKNWNIVKKTKQHRLETYIRITKTKISNLGNQLLPKAKYEHSK